MSLGLGIDAGGTATRWALADADGRPQAAGLAAPLSGHIFSRAAEARAREIVGEIAGAVGPARPDGVVAGVTGLTREAPAVALIRSMLSGAMGLPEERVFVAEDMWIAYLSYFAPGEGILVYGGTGSIGYYLGEDKETIRVGGRGNLIDDGGSAFSIARHALRHVLARRGGGAGLRLDDPARGGARARRSAAPAGTRSAPSSTAATAAASAFWRGRSPKRPTPTGGAGDPLRRRPGARAPRHHPAAPRRGAARGARRGAPRACIPRSSQPSSAEVAPLAPVIAAEVDPALTAARLAASLP